MWKRIFLTLLCGILGVGCAPIKMDMDIYIPIPRAIENVVQFNGVDSDPQQREKIKVVVHFAR